MRDSLDHLPEKKQRELARGVAIIHEEFDEALKLSTAERKKKSRIEKIILFGSHARDDWVDDNRLDGYRSDYDLLIIVNHEKLCDVSAEWRNRAEDRLMRLMSRDHPVPGPEYTMIVHTLHDINEKLERGRQFFLNIAREGIPLYELKGSKTFIKPKPLSPEMALEEARGYFNQWYPSASEFFEGYSFYMNRGSENKAAFILHQTVESAYHCLLLAFTLHSPETHNIKELRSHAEQLDQRLIEVWPRQTKKQQAPYNLLVEAYVKARYSKKFSIPSDDLQWLGQRTKLLLELVKTLCEERLG